MFPELNSFVSCELFYDQGVSAVKAAACSDAEVACGNLLLHWSYLACNQVTNVMHFCCSLTFACTNVLDWTGYYEIIPRSS